MLYCAVLYCAFVCSVWATPRPSVPISLITAVVVLHAQVDLVDDEELLELVEMEGAPSSPRPPSSALALNY